MAATVGSLVMKIDWEYASWELPDCASIMSLREVTYYLNDIRKGFPKPFVTMTSCPGEVLHPGHITSILEGKSKVQCGWSEFEVLQVVVVNDDDFLKRKHGNAFLPLKVRVQNISAIRGVDIVVPFSPTLKDDNTVIEALEAINPDFFTKGGDRSSASKIPEAKTCETYGIEMLFGCGIDKVYSSSGFLDDYYKWRVNAGR